MNFDMTEDRQMLSETLSRFLAGRYDWETRNRVAYTAPYTDAGLWLELAELGIPGALVPEEQGGFGGTGFDISVVFEALGRALCPEPFLPTLLASRVLGAVGKDQTGLVDGSIRYAVGISEIDAPYDLGGMITCARANGAGFSLSGRKTAVYGAQVADRILIAALLGGKPAVFEVDPHAAGITPYGMIDGGGAAEVLMDETPAVLLARDAGALLNSVIRAGRLALCAEAVGAMQFAYELLLDYLKTRRQFGVAIGSFQALQHRTVDLLTEIEQARSITIAAADALDGPDGDLKAVMAKNLIGRAARLVAEETIQMSGGIGMTWEYAGSHYSKRLVMIDHQLGDTDHCLEEVMQSYAA